MMFLYCATSDGKGAKLPESGTTALVGFGAGLWFSRYSARCCSASFRFIIGLTGFLLWLVMFYMHNLLFVRVSGNGLG